MSAQTTKNPHRCVIPPPLTNHHIRRQRLSGWLEMPLPATVIATAPAWYGKTTLLRDWHKQLADRGVVVVWISASELAEKPAALSGLIVTEVSRGTAARKVRQHAQRLEHSTLECCVALLESLPQIAIFLDDAASLPESLVGELSTLLRATPTTCLFVLACRSNLTSRLSAAWTRGHTHQLNGSDIALDLREIVLLAELSGVPLDQDAYKTLLQKTGGWAAAVKLTLDAHKSRQDKETSVTQSFDRISNVLTGILESEVLEQLPLKTQKFLELTSILETLTVPFCQEVSGDAHVEAQLRFLTKFGAFISEEELPLRTYHLNPIFRALLHRRLQSSSAQLRKTLHERASRWCAAHGLVVEALSHGFLAGNPTLHAWNLEKFSEQMVHLGAIHVLEIYAADITPKALRTMPRLALVMAWWRTRQYRFDEAEELMDVARKSLKRASRSRVAPRHETVEIAALLKHRELTLRSARSAIPINDEEYQKLIADFSETSNVSLQLNLYAQLFASYRQQYRITEILKHEAQASRLAEGCGVVTFTSWMRAELGAAHVESARIASAHRAFARSLDDATRFESVRNGLCALSGLYLADLCYEANDLEGASRLVETHLPAAHEFGLVDQLVTGYTLRAKLHVAEGDIDRALFSLEDGIIFADERKLDRLRRCLQGEKVRILSSLGAPTSLEEIEPLAPSRTGSKDTDTEIYDAARARVLMSKGRNTEVLRLANSWISFCTTNLAIRTLIRWQLIRTHALLLSGDAQYARRSMREALSHAARGGFVRKIVDAAQPVRALLLDIYQRPTSQTNEIDAFARKAIDIISRHTHDVKVSVDAGSCTDHRSRVSLTAKEHDILTLVADGLQNREIGERLGITEGTVKWHMQQVFRKLGVRRRAKAVSAFRAFS